MEAWLAEAVAGGPKAGGATIIAREQIKDYRLQFASFSWKRVNTDAARGSTSAPRA